MSNTSLKNKARFSTARRSLILFGIITLTGACRPHHSTPVGPPEASTTTQSEVESLMPANAARGEKAVPTIEGNLIKANNKLCAVSRTPMNEKILGAFKGQVNYEGGNPKYKGKTFEFNYCCGMCQAKFPDMFKADPDGILKFHGLL
ncbi:MAG TPA: hypothetical protein VJR29_11355 [bacterium]|nr:hypothetical protein [bacterium]